MLIRAVILALILAGISALMNADGSTIENTYQKVKTYYSLVSPKVDGCDNAIPYLKGSTIVDNDDGTFTVVVSFVCGRSS